MTDSADQTATLARLRALDTATLYESGALVTMGPEIRMLSGDGRLAGPTLTVMCPPGDNLMIHIAVAQAQPGTVLVAQCHNPGYGTFEEVMTVEAIRLGITSLVSNDSVRDIGGVQSLILPISVKNT